MFTVTGVGAKAPNQWDIFAASPPVPAPNESLEVIAATAEENECKMS
jgi:branched-chain amino acid transport system substrate-binding protein